MLAQRSIVVVYLYSLIAVALSAWLGVSVQSLLRIPMVNIRLIDIVLAVNIGIGAWAFWNYWIGGVRGEHHRLTLLQRLIILYLVFETMQLARTFGTVDVQSQIAYFMATLCMFIILYFTTHEVTPKVHEFLLWASFVGAIIIVVLVAMQLIGLTAGFVFKSQWQRVEFDVVEGKETISNTALIPLVLIYGVIVGDLQLSHWRKMVYRIALAALLVNLVLTVARGLLAMWVAVFLVFIPLVRGRSAKALTRSLIPITLVVLITFLFLGDTLTALGYNPLVKLQETFGYTTDVENPGWDKGRALAQAVALSVWLDHEWVGVGYDELNSFIDVGMAPHNGLVTSLFHRGVLGTAILFSIILICYGKSLSLWRWSRKLPIKDKLLNRSLVFIAWMWWIPLLTQEMLWERYSLSVQFIYFGIIVGLERYYRNHKEAAIDRSS